MRTLALFAILLVCVSGIGALFWHQEYKYSLPTRVPAGYKAITAGEHVSMEAAGLHEKGPLFLHFYNPDCPCSRFNASHIKSLIRTYGSSVKLMIVVPSTSDLKKANREFGENQEYVIDAQQKIAKACGVYATPQAVIIDSRNNLFYRGNYNASRYCTTKATNFAELSLLALLNNQPAPVFSLLATQAYGCELAEENSNVELSLF